METLWELLSRDRRGEATAYRVGDRRVYDYDRFITTTWQAGNYLRHFGVREGTVVGVVDAPVPEPLFATFGTALLGGMAWIEPPLGADLRAAVLPASEVERYGDLTVQQIVHGGSVENPSIERFEEGLWSENPTIPPERPDPDTPILTDGNRSYTQRELLNAAGSFEREWGIERETDVVLRASLGDPGAIVGVIGSLHASATVILPDPESARPDETALGDVTLGAGPEHRTVDPHRIAP